MNQVVESYNTYMYLINLFGYVYRHDATQWNIWLGMQLIVIGDYGFEFYFANDNNTYNLHLINGSANTGKFTFDFFLYYLK